MDYSETSQTPSYALETLAIERYGFNLVDVGLKNSDLEDFDHLQICKNKDLNEFGQFLDLKDKIVQFIKDIGPNESSLTERIATRIDHLAREIITISGKETAWVCLRAGIPNNKFDLPNWHIDGNYFKTKELQYKFIITLLGPSTLFYPLSNEFHELRSVIWLHMGNRTFMDQLCRPNEVIQPKRGIGAFFIAGDKKKGAIHSEPPISENRLLFSVVPCMYDEVTTLKQKVDTLYLSKTSVYD